MEESASPVVTVATCDNKIITMAAPNPTVPTTQPRRRYIITPTIVKIVGVKTPSNVPRTLLFIAYPVQGLATEYLFRQEIQYAYTLILYKHHASTAWGALMGQTLTQMLHSVQRPASIVTTSLIILIAIEGHRSIQPPHPTHFSVAITTMGILPYRRRA
jgi:hypothetical protein